MFSKKIFSCRLRQLRTSRNIKQKDLGQIAGISEAAIAQLESGKRGPSIDVACILARFFEVSLDYLVGLSDNPRRH
ncbi:MAG: helix-turn-helix transcriptional regulator [Firmicutes bacterium]|nr:helix-turn-helix transcriptional regulator [Bacillota bacterium]